MTYIEPPGTFKRPQHWWQNPHYVLSQPLEYPRVTVPAGFATDGLSVPRLLTLLAMVGYLAGCWYPWLLWLCAPAALSVVLFPRFGRTLRAAILHDYLLQQGMRWQFANRQFLDELQRTDIVEWRCYLMFFAVTVYQFSKHFLKRISTNKRLNKRG